MTAGTRRYGHPPFTVAVLHGGPGALGEMQPVAKAIAAHYGTLEPLLSAPSLETQIQDLRLHLQASGELPVILCGHSFGAWLAYLFAARYPSMVKKLILVSSGPFEDRYANDVVKTRLRRLSPDKQRSLADLQQAITTATGAEQDRLFSRIGQLLFTVDSYNPFPYEEISVEYRYQTFKCVWSEADTLRRTGGLLREGRRIRCPVTAIHGDYDPHPAEGVQKPLSKILSDFHFTLLEHCGHYPWLERQAAHGFYQHLIEITGN